MCYYALLFLPFFFLLSFKTREGLFFNIARVLCYNYFIFSSLILFSSIERHRFSDCCLMPILLWFRMQFFVVFFSSYLYKILYKSLFRRFFLNDITAILLLCMFFCCGFTLHLFSMLWYFRCFSFCNFGVGCVLSCYYEFILWWYSWKWNSKMKKRLKIEYMWN